MGKLVVYLAMLSVTLLLFHFAGLIENTPISFMLSILLDPQNLWNHPFYVKLTGILALLTGTAGIVIGTVAPTRYQAFVTISFTSLLFTIGWDLIAIFNVVRQTSYVLATLILSPLILIYTLTVIEWWRGKD